ncbi:unnamed protein product [Closterium sp. NIES-54]
MRLCSVSGDLELLSVILPRISCPPVPFPASSLASPLSRRVLSSQGVTFDESVSYYHLFPYQSASLPPPPLFLAPGTPPVDLLPPQGPAPSGVSQVNPVMPDEVAVNSEPGGAEPERVEPGGAEPGGAESGSAEPGGAEPERAESGGPPGVPSLREPFSPQQLREWYTLHCRRATGSGAAGGASGAARGAFGAAGGAAGAGAAGAAGLGGTGAGGTGAVGAAGGAGPDLDAPDIPTPRSYAEAIEGPYSSQWQAAMDAEMASWKSTSTYVDKVPPPGVNIISGMWIFRVKRPPGSPPVFKARYVARGFSQRQGVDFFHTFSPTTKMTTLWVLLHVAAQRDYKLHSLDFSTVFLQGSLHEEIWLHRPPGFTGSFRAGTQWSLRRPVYGLRQAPREWHDTLRTTLAALGFAPSTADPSLVLRTDTTLPPFYVLVYVEDLVFATADTEALAHVKSELQKRHTCTDLGELTSYLGLRITRDRAQRTITLTQSHMAQQVLQRFGFTYSSPLSTPLPTGHSLSAPPSDESVQPIGPYPELVGCLISSCEAEIYAAAMAAQELHWLTYVLTDLGEAPRSPPVLYVDNKAMLALCQEHRLEHRTKHIALRYFLARELQQRG